MKLGKISESVLKRSVLKICKNKREEVICGAGVGEDCAFFSFSDKEYMVTCVHTEEIENTKDIKRALYHCANNIATSGAQPVSMLLNIIFPEESYESDLKEIMLQAENVCEELNIEIAGGHTQVSNQVMQTIITVTGIGKVLKEHAKPTKIVKPGQDIIISKWIGLEGTALLAHKKEKELLKRYPEYLVTEAKGFEKYLPILPEAAVAVRSGVCAMHDASTGGIFSALWELAESANVGLDIDLKKIPIKQETIEICEYFNVNPYELLSGGSLIMTTDHGNDLVHALNQEGIMATYVGKITSGHEKVVQNEEETRFLERPKSDEIVQFKKENNKI